LLDNQFFVALRFWSKPKMDQDKIYLDMIYSLNTAINELKSSSNIDFNEEYAKFKENYSSVYLAIIMSNDALISNKNKIVEYSLVKLSNLILAKSSPSSCTAIIDYLSKDKISCSNRFESKLKLSLISSSIKMPNLNEKNKNDLLVKIIEILKSFHSFTEHNTLDFEQMLELIILNKRIMKKMLPCPQDTVNVNFIDEFLLEMIRIFDRMNRTLLDECFGVHSFSNIYAGKKYLKCLHIYLDYIEKHEPKTSSLALGKSHLENFFLALINRGVFARIVEEKPSTIDLKASFLNDYYIKLVHLSMRVLLHFEVVVRLKEPGVKLSSDFLANLRGILFREELFQLDLIYTTQDDDTIIDFNLSCLNYQLQIEKITFEDEKEENLINDLFLFDLNVHVLFVKLLASTMFDYRILIDWLISSETNFLVYLMRYLKVLLNEMSLLKRENIKRVFDIDLARVKLKSFNSILDSNKIKETNLSGKVYLDKMYALLTELNSKIKQMKRSFPYNCEPLVRLLDKVVNLI
jgi:hypothetical protein